MACNHRFFHKQSSYHKKPNNYLSQEENFPFKLQVPKSANPNKERRCLNQISTNIMKDEISFTKNESRYAQFNNAEKELDSWEIEAEQNSSFLKSGLHHPNCMVQRMSKQKSFRQRPKTSGSQFSEANTLNIKRNSLICNFGEQEGQQRMSASRALAKYCLVQRNKSNERFKVRVKKDTSNPMNLSTRKIQFQTKQKKEKTEINQSYFKEYQNARLPKQGRNLQGQEYELKGWDYY